MTLPVTRERTVRPRTVPPRRHAENPDQPGHALCGAKLAKEIRMGDGDCPLCLAVINGTRDWGTR